MKALRLFLLAPGFIVLAVAVGSCAHRAFASPARTLTGEMVVTDASANRFRVVGQDGHYTAPVGTPLQALDGHNVNVDLTSNGRVIQISEAPVHIDPITHDFGTARGEVVVLDGTTGRFRFSGDDQSYIAPTNVDVTSYAGRLVEIRLGEGGRVTDMRLVGSPQTYGSAPAGSACSYRDQAYTAGAAICQSGTQYRCDGVQWQSLGLACEVSDTRGFESPRSARTCIVGDSSVASASNICRHGSTFRCDDGAWVDLRTACR